MSICCEGRGKRGDISVLYIFYMTIDSLYKQIFWNKNKKEKSICIVDKLHKTSFTKLLLVTIPDAGCNLNTWIIKKRGFSLLQNQLPKKLPYYHTFCSALKSVSNIFSKQQTKPAQRKRKARRQSGYLRGPYK